MKGEGSFPGLLFPLAKELLNNMLCFPRALSNKMKKKRDILYQLHSILNYIQSIKRLAHEDLPFVDALCYIMREKSGNRYFSCY
jgi:hypothetical protein